MHNPAVARQQRSGLKARNVPYLSRGESDDVDGASGRSNSNDWRHDQLVWVVSNAATCNPLPQQ